MNTKFLRKDLDALKRRSEAINRAVTLVAHAYNVAADVVKENNGKTLNRRLATAIDARLLGAFGTINGFPAIRCSLERETYRPDAYTLYFWLYERSYRDADTDEEYATWSYFDDELYLRVNFDNTTGRVDSDAICAAMQVRLQQNMRVAWKYKDAVKNYARHTARYAKALEAFQRVCGELNPMLVEDQVRTYKCYYPGLSPWEARREAAIAEMTGSGK